MVNTKSFLYVCLILWFNCDLVVQVGSQWIASGILQDLQLVLGHSNYKSQPLNSNISASQPSAATQNSPANQQNRIWILVFFLNLREGYRKASFICLPWFSSEIEMRYSKQDSNKVE